MKKSSYSRRIHKERKKNKSNEKSDKNISRNSQNSIPHHDNISSPTSMAKEKQKISEIIIQTDEIGLSVR